MLVKKVTLFKVKIPLKEEFTTSFGTTRYKEAVIVKIEEKGGEVGWGEVPAGSGPWYSYETVDTALIIIRRFIIPQILKSDIDIDDYMNVVKHIRGHNMAKAGVEMALWDLKAKLQSLPLWKVIGGRRAKIVSGVSIGIKRSVNELLKTIGRHLDEGYQRIKVKIKPGWDINIVDAIRREYPDILLQVDANAAYTLRDINILRKLDDYNLLMIEQPLDYNDLVYHAILQKFIKTPICLDESIKYPEDVVRAYMLGSCLIVNLKPARVGGISNSLRIHELCYQLGLGLWIGGMLETGIGRGFLVALASLPYVNYPNDISASNRYFKQDIVEPEWTLNRDGTISVPNRSGIGVEVIEERLEKYTEHKLVFG